jgi:hypothetical protein
LTHASAFDTFVGDKPWFYNRGQGTGLGGGSISPERRQMGLLFVIMGSWGLPSFSRHEAELY